jgi:hypothetical protein
MVDRLQRSDSEPHKPGTSSLVCSNRVMDMVWPRWWHYPDKCDNGHEWGPCPVSVSRVPCDCGPVLAGSERHLDHQRVACQAPGCRSVWYQPRHEPTGSPGS